MKKSKIFWGSMFITIGVLLILNIFGVTFGLPESIPVWRILLGLIFLGITVDSIINRRIYLIFFPLAFTAALFEKELAWLG